MLIFSKYRFPKFGKVMLFAVLAAAAVQGRAQAQSLFPVLFQIVPDSLPTGGADFTLTVMGAHGQQQQHADGRCDTADNGR